MRQLLLLRHAKSSWDGASVADRDRPLNARGRRSAAAMREAMRDLGLTPDLILVSSARRTMETLDALEPWDETPLIESMDSLYLATPAQLLDALHEVPETVRGALLIGHNPGIHELALMLCDGVNSATVEARIALAGGFPTGALAEISVASSWSTLGKGGGRLVRFLSPRQLESAG